MRISKSLYKIGNHWKAGDESKLLYKYDYYNVRPPKIAKLVYNSNNYGLLYANNYSYWGL